MEMNRMGIRKCLLAVITGYAWRQGASVTASGKVTAKNPGTCRVYVQTISGLWKVVHVTVR